MAEKSHVDHLAKPSSSSDTEKDVVPTQHLGHNGRPLKLDRDGFPLVPQPTDSPADPLNVGRLRNLSEGI